MMMMKKKIWAPPRSGWIFVGRCCWMVLFSTSMTVTTTWRKSGCTEAVDVDPYQSSREGRTTGERRQWHKLTLGFNGPYTTEMARPNPFTDYRLDVDFLHSPSGQKLTVPGFYAADGNAANTGADRGSVWLVHFRPPLTGSWNWTTHFTKGTNVAQYGGGQPAGYMHGRTGSVTIGDTNKSGRDFRAHGRLQHVINRKSNGHFLQFSGSGKYFLKAGPDAPENFLAYVEFDNTPNNENRRKNWAPHIKHFRNETDPTWRRGRGRGIIGAVNYLSSMGMNVFSFLTMNIKGDDQNVFPYINSTDFMRIDVSKTEQWEVVFDHAESMGMLMHMKQQEQENDQLLDGGELGPQRRLYYRELIARFGHHLGLNWNLGEENTNRAKQVQAFAQYIKQLDPYKMPIVMHSFPDEKDLRFSPMLGNPYFDGVSIQTRPANVHNDTLHWLSRSIAKGRPWIVSNDEQNPAGTGVMPDDADPNHDDIRKNALWGNLMAGGHGVEFYFGYRYNNSDLTCQNYTTRENMWKQARVALNFFTKYKIPLWNMYNADSLVAGSNNWCLTDGKDYYVVYLPSGGTAKLTLPSGGSTFDVQWMHAKTGREFVGSSARVSPGGWRSLGSVSSSLPASDDWVVLLNRNSVAAPAPGP